MLLSDILARLSDETTAVETIVGLADLTLLAAIKARAATEGLGLAACVTQTVQRYTHEASGDEWTTLIGMLNRSQDPGATCLKRASAYGQQGRS